MTGSPKFVTIVHHCIFCDQFLSTPQKLRHHLSLHGCNIPSKVRAGRRTSNSNFTYVNTSEPQDLIQKHFGCPFCSFHHETLASLHTHCTSSHPGILSRTEIQQPAQDPISVAEPTNGPSPTPKQEKASGSNRRTSEVLDRCLLNIQTPNANNHAFVQGLDLTRAFYDFQTSIGVDQTWKLSLEDNLHSALAVSSILLLSAKHYPDDIAPFFSVNQYKETANHVRGIYQINKPLMPQNFMINAYVILQDLTNGATTRNKAAKCLLEMDLPAHLARFVNALELMIKKLPCVPLTEDMNEAELGGRYIDPFLSGLFDDPDNNMFLRWTNESTMESRNQLCPSTSRPDICVTSIIGDTWNTNHAYGEVKSAKGGANYLACYDLVKVGTFCKDALDGQAMDGTLGIQVVGRTITFYLVTLPFDGIYVMLELTKIKVPDCLKELPKLLMDLPEILMVLDVFHRLCIRSSHPESVAPYRRPTINKDTFNNLFSTSRDRKRPCTLYHIHN